MEEEIIVEQKNTTLKSLEKDMAIRLQEIDNKILELNKKIETIKKAMKNRRF